MVKNPPAMGETWIPSLGWEDPMEEDVETPSSIPAWRIPWTEEPAGYSPGVRKESAAERSTPLVCDSKGSTSLTAAVSAVVAAAAAASDSVLLPLKLIFACYVQSFTPLINHVRHSY